MVKKDIHLVGWLGIQRYPDPGHYGIDISRNGRILKKLDKSLFNWLDERAKDIIDKFHPEYPRDNKLYNGRIVGQIEANFVLPKYTKDDFNTDDQNWKLAVKYLRGEMPLQTDLGQDFGYIGLNNSPLGKLFRGFRRIDPPGKKTLMFGKTVNGDLKSDYVRQKNWGHKFNEGDIEYIDEKKWLEEIDHTELKEAASTFNPITPHIRHPYSTDQIRVTSPNEDKYPGRKIFIKTIHLDIENIIGEKPYDIILHDYFPTSEINSPIIFVPQGSIGKFDVYINNSHPMLNNFADGYEELLFMEVAYRYTMLKNSDEWTLTRIYYELKLKYLPETMLSVSNLVINASKLIKEIHKKLISGDGYNLTHKPNLSESEERVLINKYLDVENMNLGDINTFVMNTKFMKYLDLNYIFKFVEEFPEIIYDGRILNLPYSTLDDESKIYQLKKYTGYFDDINWFMNILSKESDDASKKLKQQILRNRESLKILYGNLTK